MVINFLETYIYIYLIIHSVHSPRGFSEIILQHWLGDFARLLIVQFTSNEEISDDAPYVSVKLR